MRWKLLHFKHDEIVETGFGKSTDRGFVAHYMVSADTDQNITEDEAKEISPYPAILTKWSH
jgi:hypothetical protein